MKAVFVVRRTVNQAESEPETTPAKRNPVYNISLLIEERGQGMTETVVTLRLNQQQLELMDRTIAQGVAADRVALVRLALREYAAAREAEKMTEAAR
jgi:hypothetical protein